MKLYRLFGLVIMLPLLKAQRCQSAADCGNSQDCINLSGGLLGCAPRKDTLTNADIQAALGRVLNSSSQPAPAAPNPQSQQRAPTTSAECSMNGPNTCPDGMICLENKCVIPTPPVASNTPAKGPKTANNDDRTSRDFNDFALPNGTVLNPTQLTELFKMLTDANRTNNTNVTNDDNDTDSANSTNGTTKNNTNVPKVAKPNGAADAWSSMISGGSGTASVLMISYMVFLN